MTQQSVIVARGRENLPFSVPRGFLYLAAAVVLACIAPGLRAGGHGSRLLAVALAVGAVSTHVVRRWRTNGRFVLEPPVLLVIVFLFWHFSYWFVYFAGLAAWYRVDAFESFAPAETTFALWLCVIALFALLAGVEAGMAGLPLRPVKQLRGQSTRPIYLLAASGAVLIVGYFAIDGHRLVGHYASVFLEDDGKRRIYNLGIVLLLASLGPLMHSGEHGTKRSLALLTIIAPAVGLTVLLGSRWVLFCALLIVLGARTMRGAALGPFRVAGTLVGAIVIGVVVKALRAGNVTGVAGARSAISHYYTNPFTDFFVEIGQTFLAVAGATGLRAAGVPLLFGRSFADGALTVIPSAPAMLHHPVVRPMRDLAAYYFPQKYATEGYTIGYSIVAELYANFSLPGVLVGMALIGYGVARVYRRFLMGGGYAPLFATYAVVGLFIFGMRNDTVTWLRYAVWGLALAWLIGRRLDSRGNWGVRVTP